MFFGVRALGEDKSPRFLCPSPDGTGPLKGKRLHLKLQNSNQIKEDLFLKLKAS